MRSPWLMLRWAQGKWPTATTPAARSRVITALSQTPAIYETDSWDLGYAFEAWLDHARVARIRRRLGIDGLPRFFEQVVDLCQEAGMVWGRELYVDATTVEATSASGPSSLASPTRPRRT
jgi:hypothetical protein